MRARQTKPGIFKNEILGSADPLLTLLFIGLTQSADREGRLEDRPLRITAEVFPYRRRVTETRCDSMLHWLNERKFIFRYIADGKRYIQIANFLKHQNPHRDEKPSVIPPLTLNGHSSDTVEASGAAQCATDKSTDVVRLTPSSLTPSSLHPTSPLPEHRAPPGGGGPSSPGRKKTAEEIEALARAEGLDIFAMPGEPGYCGDRQW